MAPRGKHRDGTHFPLPPKAIKKGVL